MGGDDEAAAVDDPDPAVKDQALDQLPVGAVDVPEAALNVDVPKPAHNDPDPDEAAVDQFDQGVDAQPLPNLEDLVSCYEILKGLPQI